MGKIKVKNCKVTHGKFNVDTGNVVIQADIELDTKEVTKNVALEVEHLLVTKVKGEEIND